MTLCENAQFFQKKRMIYDIQDNSVLIITKAFKNRFLPFGILVFFVFQKLP